MSLISTLKQQRQASNGFFCAIGGARMAGKSTIAGTLPGKTIIIQPRGMEAGNQSPVVLAEQLGNSLDMIEVESIAQLFEVVADEELLSYDNIYVDGISAITDMLFLSPEFAAKTKKNKWDGFDYIKQNVQRLIMQLKHLADTGNKNVFLTYALEPKFDENGNVKEVVLVAKGNASRSMIEGQGSNVVLISEATDKGEIKRGIFTKNRGPYSARVGDILDEGNPGIIRADLSELLKLARRV
jgi:hypothetical protein